MSSGVRQAFSSSLSTLVGRERGVIVVRVQEPTEDGANRQPSARLLATSIQPQQSVFGATLKAPEAALTGRGTTTRSGSVSEASHDRTRRARTRERRSRPRTLNASLCRPACAGRRTLSTCHHVSWSARLKVKGLT